MQDQATVVTLVLKGCVTRAAQENLAVESSTGETPLFSYVIRCIERRQHNLAGTKILQWLPTNLCLRSTLSEIGLLTVPKSALSATN